MAETDGKRPSSFIEDDPIEIKPSTELIPDEYERENNENMLVELIYRITDEETEDLAKQLTKLGFSINKTCIERISNMDEAWVKSFVDDVNNKTKQRSYDGLLMIFAKVSFRADMLKSIWQNFTSKNCPALKNKPKMFIFQIFKRGPSSDSVRIPLQIDLRTAYDTPGEADILIVFDKITSDSSNDFLENFQQHIKDYSLQEDIINLASLSIGSETRPLVISTMTRKFFFTINEYRGHHHNINENHIEIKENLEKIINYVKNIPDNKPKDKDKGLMSSFRKTFSFKSKSHGKESETNENKIRDTDKAKKLREVKEEKLISELPKRSVLHAQETTVFGDSSTKKKPKPLKPPEETFAVPPSKSPIRKTSIPIPSTSTNSPTRKTSRTRYPSGSFNSKEDLSKKQPWK